MESQTPLTCKIPVTDLYFFGAEIGKGTYGSVRLCTPRGPHIPQGVFACKTILLEQAMNKQKEKTLCREMQMLQKLRNHPHVVQLSGVHVDHLGVHFVMELCQGGDLYDALEKHGHFSEPVAFEIFTQLLTAVQKCHSEGVVHRDLKPENVLLKTPLVDGDTSSVQIRLADFGLAVQLGEGEEVMEMAGSPYYMAPEVTTGNHVTYGPKADMWSLGIILHVLLSGVLPFVGDDIETTFKLIRKGRLDFSGQEWSHVSPGAIHLIRWLLAVDPRKRPTIEELVFEMVSAPLAGAGLLLPGGKALVGLVDQLVQSHASRRQQQPLVQCAYSSVVGAQFFVSQQRAEAGC